MQAPSVFTRRAFREWFVGTTLAYIDDQFSAVAIAPTDLPPDQRPGGQRRNRVEEYYAAVDWESRADVARVLLLYEHILSEATPDERAKLERRLKMDGYAISAEGRITPARPEILEIDTHSLQDPHMFRTYEQRILENVEVDPALAIGTAKELLEATCKLLLEDAGTAIDSEWKIPQLFKAAAKTLDLTVDSVPTERTGADEIRKVLASLAQIVVGTAELRNMYGTGHGRPRRVRLRARHARLVAGASLTLVRFILDTRAEQSARDE
ncbi:MAG: hypothetical protein E6J20_18470 [Chloroflexi bacterium]|nr:MAG: hypothetical protein E6J20_18470 [Chloroflexota bacterium]